jgi:hypothetical protein
VILANYLSIQQKLLKENLATLIKIFFLFLFRFGQIMSLVAKRDIEPGEEIFTSYNYDVQKAPVWYQVRKPWCSEESCQVSGTETMMFRRLLSGIRFGSHDVQKALVRYQVWKP